MSDSDYAEYRCSACKKDIKSIVVQCKVCAKAFFHPGCVIKHKVYNKNRELVKCEGPYEQFPIEVEKVEMKKSIISGNKDKQGSINTANSSLNMLGNMSKASIDNKIDGIVNMLKEMRDIMVCKNEIKKLIKEILYEELNDLKREIAVLKENVGENSIKSVDKIQKSYAETVSDKKKENVVIIKPKKQQASETTKQQVKEKVDITNMAIGISKFKKGGNGSIILGCESTGEMDKLKESMQVKLGDDYKIIEPRKIKPRIKIINVGMDEMEMEDENLVDMIKRQNIDNEMNDGFYIKLVKRIVRKNKIDTMQPNKGKRSDGALILEVDEVTYNVLLNKKKVNVGWNKCIVLEYFNVKRCFKCWGFRHMAKDCTRQDTCHKCAGNHLSNICTAEISKCVNCFHKNKTYNMQMDTKHDALSAECPTFKRVLEEVKKKTSWDVAK